MKFQLGRKKKVMDAKQINLISQWCVNARRLGYTKQDIKEKVKNYPRDIKNRILKTFKDLEYVMVTNKLFNDLKQTNLLSEEDTIKKIFRMGSTFYLRTGDLNKTFKLMNKRIMRI